MDARNLFLTPVTYRLLRLEYLAGLVTALVLAVLHHDEIRWSVFVALFVVIDVVGYLPGHVTWRLRGGEVPRVHYVLYNLTHSLVTSGLVAAAWCLLVRPEWALLALPIHLLGDRALFGNALKPFGVAFEPRPHPAYERFRSDYVRTTRHPRAGGPADGASLPVGGAALDRAAPAGLARAPGR